ncbi:hypothetical protein BCR39DRAFT_591391 [Naematelia encephala]|uniref:DUF6534 domain-containing protein n=1 Tax=Naematelia encephala TaxID=71784 RepID=A0A1Y2AI23_9TREE|nr:hypothetical protein BCR39DRAFT_591391 [Naematelia encephala]
MRNSTQQQVTAQSKDHDVSTTTGPFFLGFMLESFGMGVVLILAINYLADCWRRLQQPHHGSMKLGAVLVVASLLAHVGQWLIDMIRGWKMFATSFLDLTSFLTPTPLFFASPVLGQIPMLITQLFLLHRASLFLTSMECLSPISHSWLQRAFYISVGLLAVLTSAAGALVWGAVWKCGGLWNLGKHSIGYGSDSASIMFPVAQNVYLASSATIDLLVSVVLCVELTWARCKTTMEGGRLHQVVTRLILVTLHGGAAVTLLQLASLLVYNLNGDNAFPYFPLLILPKVYTVTLILSLSLPHRDRPAPGPSYLFSLPTIAIESARTPSRVEVRRASCPASLRELEPNQQRDTTSRYRRKTAAATESSSAEMAQRDVERSLGGSGSPRANPEERYSDIRLDEMCHRENRPREALVESRRATRMSLREIPFPPPASPVDPELLTPPPLPLETVELAMPLPPPKCLSASHHFATPPDRPSRAHFRYLHSEKSGSENRRERDIRPVSAGASSDKPIDLPNDPSTHIPVSSGSAILINDNDPVESTPVRLDIDVEDNGAAAYGVIIQRDPELSSGHTRSGNQRSRKGDSETADEQPDMSSDKGNKEK